MDAPAPGAPRPREADRALALPRGLLVLLSMAGVVVAVAGLRSASGIVGPAFLALTIAITIHPPLAWLQRRRVPGWLAVVLTMLVAYVRLVALAAALVFSGARLATLLPSYQRSSPASSTNSPAGSASVGSRYFAPRCTRPSSSASKRPSPNPLRSRAPRRRPPSFGVTDHAFRPSTTPGMCDARQRLPPNRSGRRTVPPARPRTT
jgi:hypothetical protein